MIGRSGPSCGAGATETMATTTTSSSPPIDDASRSGGGYRTLLRGDAGYRDAKKQLDARWAMVWLDLAADWVLLGASVAATIAAQGALGGWWVLAVVPLASLAIGLFVHRIGMFSHEGAHFNVAPGKRANDLVCNLFSSALILTDIRVYRPIHLAHHRHLGTPQDTEVTYTNSLGPRLLFRCLTGLAVIDALEHRKATAPVDLPKVGPWVPLLGVLLHLAFLGTTLLTGNWWVTIAWAAGAFSLHPTFNSIRQALEHRSEEARAEVDYGTVDHGAVTRMFTRSRLSGILGGVGFDHHLLHHWEPGVSYTRLPDLQRYLHGTEGCGPIIEARNTTYLQTLRRLWAR